MISLILSRGKWVIFKVKNSSALKIVASIFSIGREMPKTEAGAWLQGARASPVNELFHGTEACKRNCDFVQNV